MGNELGEPEEGAERIRRVAAAFGATIPIERGVGKEYHGVKLEHCTPGLNGLKYGAYSYSKIQTYKKCPAKFKFAYIDLLRMPKGESPAMARGSEIHKSIEQFIKKETDLLHPDIREAYTQYFFGLRESYRCFPEAKFALKGGELHFDPKKYVTAAFEACEWDDPETVFRGFYDLKVVWDGGLFIDEFKTGKPYPEHMEQRLAYGTVALIQHPEVDHVEVRTVYLDKVNSVPVTYPQMMLIEYTGGLRRNIMECENDTVFAPQPSFMCRYCEYSRQNNGPCLF